MEDAATVLLSDATLTVPRANRRPARLIQIQPLTLDLGTSFKLADAPLTLGRGPDCLIGLDDASVSRQHARIEPEDEGHCIVDLESTNQTLVNGQAVTRQHLTDGDYVQVGNFVLRYLTEGNVEAEYHATVRRLTITDPLTLLLNRRALLELLGRELSRSARHARPLTLGLFDVDGFKAINDGLGHHIGDLLLVQLAWRVQSAIRKEDVLARLGGDEFVLLLPDTLPDRADVVAQRVRQVVESEPFQLDANAITVKISLGLTGTPGGEPVSAEELLQRADAEMYAIKRSRGHRGHRAGPAGPTASRDAGPDCER